MSNKELSKFLRTGETLDIKLLRTDGTLGDYHTSIVVDDMLENITQKKKERTQFLTKSLNHYMPMMHQPRIFGVPGSQQSARLKMKSRNEARTSSAHAPKRHISPTMDIGKWLSRSLVQEIALEDERHKTQNVYIRKIQNLWK